VQIICTVNRNQVSRILTNWIISRSAIVINSSISSSVFNFMVQYVVYCINFFRAMLCIRGTSQGPVSVCVCVCLSVTSRCSTKTAKRRITQTTPHDSPGTLVFRCERSPRNSTGVTPYEGAECRWGGSKSATFDIYPAISRKR